MKKIVLVLLLLLIGIVQVAGADCSIPGYCPAPGVTVSPTFGQAPLTVQFSAEEGGNIPGGNITGWYWNFGDGATSTLQNPSHTYANYGIYTFNLTTTNSAGNAGTNGGIVYANLPLPNPNFIATPASGPAPLTVQFTDTSTGHAARWSWDFGDGHGVSAIQNPKYTFYCNFNGGNTPLIMSVKLYTWDSFGFCTDQNNDLYNNNCISKTLNIVLTSPPPPPTFTATPISGPAPLTVQFTDTSSYNPTIWSWDFGDNTNAYTQNPVHTYTISGVYTARLNHPGMINDQCNGYLGNIPNTTITVLSPLAPGTTTSPTPSLNQTATTTTSTTTLPTTTVTAQTTVPAATVTQTVTATPSGFYYTPKPTVTTMKVFTSIPTSTPTQKSPFGIEFSILAISAAILIVRSQYRKP